MHTSVTIKNIKLQNISYQEESDWNTILQRSDDATIFHTPEWVRLTVEKTGAKSKILIAYHAQEPVGIFPSYIKETTKYRKVIRTTLFETPYGGPISVEGVSKKEVIKHLIRRQERLFNIFDTEIILPPDYEIGPFVEQGYNIASRETLVLHLEKDEDTLWRGIGSKTRNMVRKAEKCGLNVIKADKTTLNEVHEILADTYKRLGVGPPPPLIYYERIFDNFYFKDMVNMLLAIHDGKPIAVAIFLLFKKTVIYWEAGSYREYWKYAPNDLIQWNVIKNSATEGYKYYDMLHYHDKNGQLIPSLRAFKLGFGAKPRVYYTANKMFEPYKSLKMIKECTKKLTGR